MQPTRYVVRQGDTFWGIAKRHFGNATRWPDLYAFNNQPGIVAATRHTIVDPNLIRPGQVLFLPARLTRTAGRSQPPTPASRASSNAPAPGNSQVAASDPQGNSYPPTAPSVTAPIGGALQRPFGSGPSVGGSPPMSGGTAPAPRPALPAAAAPRHENPATTTTVNDFGFGYHFEDVPVLQVAGPGFTATLKLKGAVFIQSTSHVPLIAYTNRGAEMQARNEATMMFGQLVSGSKLSWDAKDNKVTFECQMTIRANARSPGAQLSAGVDSNGQPVLKATIVYPRAVTGRIHDHVFAARDFKIEVELKPDNNRPGTGPQPVPVAAPVPSAQPSHSGKLWGVALIGAAVLVVGATLLEDAVTEGAGVADDPESFALAARLVQMGRSAMTTQMTPALAPAAVPAF